MCKFVLRFLLMSIVLLSFSCSNEMKSSDAKQNTVAKEEPVKTKRVIGVNYKVGNTNVNVRIVHIDGHDYIVAASCQNYTNPPGGVSVIHSESCKCHKNQ